MKRSIWAALVVACFASVAQAADKVAYKETPSLQADVQKKTLPGVAARVPSEPLVVDLKSQGREIGRPGGILRMLLSKEKDVRLLNTWGYARLVAWTPKLTYRTYPNYRAFEGSDYPTFSVRYQKALQMSDNSVSFDKIRLLVEQDDIKTGIAGFSELSAEFGSFLSKSRVDFMDFHHFNGNETFVATSKNYMNGFFGLPYYGYSTTGNYFAAHWQHHFNGFLFDKIPLLRKLGFSEVVRLAYLTTPELKNYAEIGFGIDNIGWGLFRLFRFDVSWKFQDEKFNPKPVLMLGIKL